MEQSHEGEFPIGSNNKKDNEAETGTDMTVETDYVYRRGFDVGWVTCSGGEKFKLLFFHHRYPQCCVPVWGVRSNDRA